MNLNIFFFNCCEKINFNTLGFLGVLLSFGIISNTSDAMDVFSSERKKKRDSLFLNLEVINEENYDSLELNAEMTRNIVDSKKKSDISKIVYEHISKYPELFSEEGFRLQAGFLNSLKKFVKNALLFRVNDGDGEKSDNNVYYNNIKTIWIDYGKLISISGYYKDSDKELEKFYKNDSLNMFQNYLISSFRQRNACLIILNQIESFSVKWSSQVSNGGDQYSTEAIEGFRLCFVDTSEFLEKYKKLLIICLEERKNFITLLNDINDVCMIGGKTPEDSVQNSQDILTCASEEAQNLLVRREAGKKAVEERRMVEKKSSEESFDVSVKRTASEPSLEVDLNESHFGNKMPKKAYRLKRRFSQKKVEKSSSSEFLEKNDKNKDKK